MSGLNFSLGGKLDPSYKASLNQAEAEARAAGLRIQNSLRKQIGALDQTIKASPTGSAESTAALEKKASLQRAMLIAQNAGFVASARRRVEAAEEAGKMASNISKATTGVSGLNLIMRETLVVFREIGRGNWSRVPGSVSLIVQGFAQMKEISLLTLGVWAGAIGGIVASFFIYLHRIKKEAQALATDIIYAFKPEHLAGYQSKLEVLNELQKDLVESARGIQEAHDSVSESMQRELDLTRDRISYERELLEAQKANALAAAKNPAEREAIEKKFSKLILAKKKEERDAELQAMKDEAKQLPEELYGTKYQIANLTNSGAFMSEGQDAEILRKRRAASDAADQYFKQLDPADKDSRAHSADADRKLISELMAKEGKRTTYRGPEGQEYVDVYHLSDTERANVAAARTRLSNNSGAQQALNAWIDSKGERDRARERVKELEKRVKDDSDRLAKLNGTPGHGGLIADEARKNLQRDREDLALENERLKRVDAGRPLSGREVTERERVGFGSPTIALLDVNRSMDRKLSVLVQQGQRKTSSGSSASFGDPHLLGG